MYYAKLEMGRRVSTWQGSSKEGMFPLALFMPRRFVSRLESYFQRVSSLLL
jgi:hypothetical protein